MIRLFVYLSLCLLCLFPPQATATEIATDITLLTQTSTPVQTEMPSATPTLSTETLTHILSFLDTKAAVNSRLVCLQWDAILTDNNFIRNNTHLYHVPARKMLKVIEYFSTNYRETIEIYRAPLPPGVFILYDEATNLLASENAFKRKIMTCPVRAARTIAYSHLVELNFTRDNFSLAYYYALTQKDQSAERILKNIKDYFSKPDTEETAPRKKLMLEIMTDLTKREETRSLHQPTLDIHPIEKNFFLHERVQKAKRRCCEINEQVKKYVWLAPVCAALYRCIVWVITK